MKLDVMLRLLARAEAKLKIDGLFLQLQVDGSGCVASFAGPDVDDRQIFRFETSAALIEWLHNARVVDYDDEGIALEAKA